MFSKTANINVKNVQFKTEVIAIVMDKNDFWKFICRTEKLHDDKANPKRKLEDVKKTYKNKIIASKKKA